MEISKVLVEEFNLKPFQVNNTIKLIDEGNTIPFIARYRKEQTGELSDVVLREFYDRLVYLRNLDDRKEDVIRLIEEQGKLTDKLQKQILEADTLQRVEDLYRPFKKKRKTRGLVARERGLEPLADILLAQDRIEGDLEDLAIPFLNKEKGVESISDAYNGAMDIVAEMISDNPEFRRWIRNITFKKGMLESEGIEKEKSSQYNMYYSYKDSIKSIPDHRILAMNRGEKEKFLRVKIIAPEEEILGFLYSNIIKDERAITTSYLKMSISDSYKRLIAPSIEREVRSYLTERAEEEAIKIFSKNLKSLLMQFPIKGKVVIGLDPGFRTGCKVAVVDEIGKVLDTCVIYPTEPQNDIEGAKKILKELINKYDVDIISIGNGTASRETEMVVGEMLKEISKKVYYVIVSEAGASVYSASEVANEEFPDMDVSLRGAVSIARRLQDPLAELVKIEPKHIGVGQYQHDLNQKRLEDALEAVVEDCVNSVGVDLNTASASLLSYISGINKSVSKNIVEYRENNGKFKNRKELLNVNRLGEQTFIQCAGFLRISDGENPLDNTSVHPESYDVAENLLKIGKLDEENIEELSKKLNVGIPTLKDIIHELKKPGRDPREDMIKPIFRKDVLKLEDLKPDMIVMGTVRNVVDFGAFVDIGVKEDGLVHISNMSNNYVKHPLDIVEIGDIINVRILDIDLERKRISLSMKDI